MYRHDSSIGNHISHSVEDPFVSRLINSLRPTEPKLLEHLDHLKRISGTRIWKLTYLMDAIRSYERKRGETATASYATDPRRPESSEFIRHYKEGPRKLSVRSYDFFDPTTYNQYTAAANVARDTPLPALDDESEFKRRRTTYVQRDLFTLPSQLPEPSFLTPASINRIVTETLLGMHPKTYPSSHIPPAPATPTPNPKAISRFGHRARIPTHSIRCGSADHVVWQYIEEDDDRAVQARLQHQDSSAFNSLPFEQRGSSLSHTWAPRPTTWPK